jgi:hypothetical protein
MGRPPIPRRRTSTSGALAAGQALLDYLPSEFGDFARRQRELAAEELGFPPPAAAGDAAEGDFAGTLMELSALVAHVLAVYQRRFANEAFLRTAQSPRSLVRHGRRLGYEPSPGLSSTGHVVLWAKKGVSGSLPQGFALGSGPAGDRKEQDYETTADVAVDVDLNELWPAGRSVDASPWARSVVVRGAVRRLRAGDVVVQRIGVGPFAGRQVHVAARTLAEAPAPLPDGTTRLTFDAELQPRAGVSPSSSEILADPAESHHLFAWDTPPSLFEDDALTGDALPPTMVFELPPFEMILKPPMVTQLATSVALPERTRNAFAKILKEGAPPQMLEKLSRTYRNDPDVKKAVESLRRANATDTGAEPSAGAGSQGAATTPSTPAEVAVAGYTAPSPLEDGDLFLDGEAGASPAGGPVLCLSDDGDPVAYWCESAITTAVELTKRFDRSYEYPAGGGTKTASVTTATSVARTVTALRLQDERRVALTRGGTGASPRATRWLFGWRAVLPVIASEASVDPVVNTLELEGKHEGLKPGRLVALEDVGATPETEAAIVRLTSADVVGGTTVIGWEPVDPADQKPFRAGAVRVLGNLVAVAHGKTFSDVLGDSDGVTPFLHFELKKAPLSWLPGPGGAEPVLEVRVGGVRWTRVLDFEDSSPEDRDYLLQRDERGRTFVVFGDGKKGAVPAAGTRHITARWRVGIGTVGDVAPRVVSRIKKASPLLERAWNPRAIGGGAEPAGADDVRRGATGLVQTFDRAVSVEDHARLALLFPGIARARAGWALLDGGVEGVRLVVGTTTGATPDTAPLRHYLDARRDPSVPLAVVGPTAVPLRLELGVEHDPAFERPAVERAIRDRLCSPDPRAPGLFSFGGRDLGQPAFLSEIYEAVQAVAGVSYVEVAAFDTAPSSDVGPAKVVPPRLLDTVLAAPDQWLSLSSSRLTFATPEREEP